MSVKCSVRSQQFIYAVHVIITVLIVTASRESELLAFAYIYDIEHMCKVFSEQP